jgi:hypothetical protein
MAITPVNLLEEMMRRAQQVQGVPAPPPRQYVTPGMGNYTMSPSGTPEIAAPPSIAGTGQMQQGPQAAGPSAPLPTPGQVVQGGITFGPQVNQGTPPTQGNPLEQARPRTSEDPLRRRKQIGGN